VEARRRDGGRGRSGLAGGGLKPWPRAALGAGTAAARAPKIALPVSDVADTFRPEVSQILRTRLTAAALVITALTLINTALERSAMASRLPAAPGDRSASSLSIEADRSSGDAVHAEWASCGGLVRVVPVRGPARPPFKTSRDPSSDLALSVRASRAHASGSSHREIAADLAVARLGTLSSPHMAPPS
jgi:hypothetical protein